MYQRVAVIALASSLVIAPLGVVQSASLLPSLPLVSSLPLVGSAPSGSGPSLSGNPAPSFSGQQTSSYHSTGNETGRYDHKILDPKKFEKFLHKKPHKMKYAHKTKYPHKMKYPKHPRYDFTRTHHRWRRQQFAYLRMDL